jgi:hypothetical protein
LFRQGGALYLPRGPGRECTGTTRRAGQSSRHERERRLVASDHHCREVTVPGGPEAYGFGPAGSSILTGHIPLSTPEDALLVSVQSANPSDSAFHGTAPL